MAAWSTSAARSSRTRCRGAPADRALRTALKESLPRQWMFGPAMKAGQLLRPFLPAALKNKVPKRQAAGVWPRREHARKMLLLDGCVQPTMSPNINAATARVLDALGVQLIVAPRAGCCGAIRHHLNDHDAARDDMRRNIDAWWPYVEAGAEAIVMTASGCGVDREGIWPPAGAGRGLCGKGRSALPN